MKTGQSLALLSDRQFLMLAAGAGVLAAVVMMNARTIAKSGASAAVGTAGDLVAGTAVGIGEIFGIPDTDAALCRRALAEGRYWDASFHCPAKDFLGGVFGRPGASLDAPGGAGASGGW
jgi:hypothetical protein